MTTLELLEYYANLLIIQYAGKFKAFGTIETFVAPVLMPQTSVQTIAFSDVPTSGQFSLEFNDSTSSLIDWNSSTADIQTIIRSLGDLSAAVVTGSIAEKLLTVTMVGALAPADLFVVEANTLQASSIDVILTVAETDLSLPLAVQDGFNLVGDSTAVGAQLDVLGKYTGVTRTGIGFTTQITLDDADFLQLIKLATVTNNAGSSLLDIQTILHNFFPDEILVFDHLNMRMSYLISQSVGSQDLVQLFITENLIPRPMAVAVSIIYAPIIETFFGFRTYEAPAVLASPFNTYADYETDRPWLTYLDAVSA